MIWVASLVLLGLYSWICYRSIRHGLLVFVASLPLYLVRLQIGPLPTTLLELQFAVLFIAWLSKFEYQLIYPRELVRSIRQYIDKRDRGLVSLLGVSLLLMVAGGLLGLLQSQDLLGSLNVLKSYVIEPALLLIMIWSVEHRQPVGTTKVTHRSIIDYIVALCIPVIFASIVAIFQGATGLFLPDAWSLEARATSIFPYPNALGHFVAPMIPLTLFLLLAKDRPFRPWQGRVLLAALALGSIALFASQTEAAIIAIAATVCLGAGFYAGRRITIPLMLAGMIILAILPGPRSILVEKITLQDWSGQTRVAIWSETMDFLTDSPRNFLLGAGPDNYPKAIEPYHTHDYLEIFQYPHNLFLNSWVEYGLLGLAGLLLMMITLGIYLFRHHKLNFVVPLTAAIVETIIHGLVDVPYFKNDLAMMIWILIALTVLTTRRRRWAPGVVSMPLG